MKLKLPKISLDFQSILLFILAVGFLVNSMALYYQEHNPWVVMYNPMTNIAKTVRATRDEKSVRDVQLGGFRNAVAIATASHPFPITKPGEFAVKDSIMQQMFSDDAARYVMRIREQTGLYHVYGNSELVFNSERLNDIKIVPTSGGLYFESYFNQVIPTRDNKKTIRTFHVKGLGNIAPGTIDNPYQIKFAELKITEIQPKKPRR